MTPASLERLEKLAAHFAWNLGDPPAPLPGDHAQTAADLRSILAEREKLREALGNISRMRVVPDNAINISTLLMAGKIARAALAPSVASETCTDETRDRREVGR